MLFKATYNLQHRPLTVTDAAGQTTTFTYNSRGQLLTETNPKNETVTYIYDTNGYLVTVDGPLPGTNDSHTATYDAVGRTRTRTDESGYTVTFDYDNLDRLTRITHPDGTFSEFIFERLDLVSVRDRAGRITSFEYDPLGQMKQRTDPLGRTTLLEWCRCGDIKSLTDPMGRTTSWITDVQGRLTAKQYADGSQVQFLYEGASGRLSRVIDEKRQVTQFSYNLDDTLQSVVYGNSGVPTPGVTYTYDTNYVRLTAMTDGLGTTRYAYHPIMPVPSPGAGQLAGEDGPLPNDTITYGYDELGRIVRRAIGGVPLTVAFDAAGRFTSASNVLGAFVHSYDGPSLRMTARVLPNGQVEERAYGAILQDLELQRITHRRGATAISEFLYGHDHAAGRITTWSQKNGAQTPSVHDVAYDDADQLLTVNVTNAGALVGSFGYTYDPLGNRLTETVDGTTRTATYNALNQLSTSSGPGPARNLEWDAKDRLVAVTAGSERTEFTYDGLDRLVVIRHLVNGAGVSLRRFVWCGNEICEERSESGVVTKRFFAEGMRIEGGAAAGTYYYTRDHLGSVREVTDAAGNVRARYAYDPWGRPTRLAGDLESHFGFAGMFWSTETELFITRFRAYDPSLGRWLSRDPLPDAERKAGPNLYAYVDDSPLNRTDPLGLLPDNGEKPYRTSYEELQRQREEREQELRRWKEAERRWKNPSGNKCGVEKFDLEFFANERAPGFSTRHLWVLENRPDNLLEVAGIKSVLIDHAAEMKEYAIVVSRYVRCMSGLDPEGPCLTGVSASAEGSVKMDWLDKVMTPELRAFRHR